MDTYTATAGRQVLGRACDRCGGRGLLPRFGHVHRGVCFKCEGAGIVALPARQAARVLRAIERHAWALADPECTLGYITHRRGAQGALLIAVDGEAQGLDTFAGRWYTLCDVHGTAIAHRTRRLMLGHLRDPETAWCEGCVARALGEAAQAAGR